MTVLRLAPLILVALVTCGGSERSPDEKLARIESLYAGYQAEFPEVSVVSIDELLSELDGTAPPVLLDVRTREERTVSMIPGAVSLETFEEDPERFAGRRLVTYCTVGYRSGRVAQRLAEEGWPVRNLAGSILAWTHTGRPLERDGSPSRVVHVYGSRWDLAGEEFETVW